jgi:hypothetical protein
VATGALLRALVGALTSPLKLVGAVLPTGEGGGSLAPEPIRFEPGVSLLSPAGREQIGQLAQFVAGRPGLGVELSAPHTVADARGLREQALRKQLGPRGGLLGTVRNVGARGRIVDALDARARGDVVTLDPEDAATLDEYLQDVPAPTAAELSALGAARLSLVETALREDYGIPPTQVRRAEAVAADPADVTPGVAVELGVAGE